MPIFPLKEIVNACHHACPSCSFLHKKQWSKLGIKIIQLCLTGMFLPVKNLLPAKTLEAIWNCNRFRCWIITYKFSTSAFLFSLVCGLLRVFLSGIADPALSKVKSFKGLKTRVLAEHQSLGNELWIKSVELSEKQNFNMLEGFFVCFHLNIVSIQKKRTCFPLPETKEFVKILRPTFLRVWLLFTTSSIPSQE